MFLEFGGKMGGFDDINGIILRTHYLFHPLFVLFFFFLIKKKSIRFFTNQPPSLQVLRTLTMNIKPKFYYSLII